MVRLGWKPSPSAGVAGYYLCWGLGTGQCTNRLDAGSVTNVAVADLLTGPTYYFTVVAYSAYGDEAPPSNEVSYSVPASTINQPPTLDGNSDITLVVNSAPQTVLITGIGPGSSSENQLVTLSAFSSKPLLVSPVVEASAASATTTLTLVIAANAVGKATITVVADDGQPTNNLTTRTFAVTVVPALPPQTPLTNVTIVPYATFSCFLPAPFPNTNRVNYTLEPGAPDNATIKERAGVAVLAWTPTSAQASKTNLFSVRATDSTDPTLTTNFFFAVTVLDYLAVSPGTVAVEAGLEVSLPLYLVSSEPLNNLTFTVSWPSDKLTNTSLTLATDSIFTGSLQVQETRLEINLCATAGRSFVGSNLVATLNFTASSNQLSAFIPVATIILSGIKPTNGSFADLFPGLGEVMVIRDHPLLKAWVQPNSTRMLNLFGRLGATYRVLYATSLPGDPVWQLLTTYTQTNVVQPLTIGNSDPTVFYRLEQQ
jgi:hypothetical protein